MSDTKGHVEGIYFNSSDTPVFLEGQSIGGHDYVYLEGYLRVPGYFVKVNDPEDDPDAPETFKVAYARMMEKGQDEKKPTRLNSPNRRSNVIPVEEKEEESEEPTKETKPKSTKTSRTRKGGSDTTSGDKASQ